MASDYVWHFTTEAEACHYDLDRDGVVDLDDLLAVANRWNDPTQYQDRYDVSPAQPDSIVDIRDIMAWQAIGSRRARRKKRRDVEMPGRKGIEPPFAPFIESARLFSS
ncbi:MAG TPA: hypothetical protein EYH31_13880, partial [Anaerolineae bacterium]|nr:hypothetical protein [Anaerolineae bacterium]